MRQLRLSSDGVPGKFREAGRRSAQAFRMEGIRPAGRRYRIRHHTSGRGDDLSREYPGVNLQAVEAHTAGGRRRRKEELGRLRALISPAVQTTFAARGTDAVADEGTRISVQGGTCHDENWSESACVTLTELVERGEYPTLDFDKKRNAIGELCLNQEVNSESGWMSGAPSPMSC